MNSNIESRQQTFDDTECVLAPENREKILEPWNPNIDYMQSALRKYDELRARRALREILFGDPLF